MPSMNPENIKVEIKLYAKKGIAKVQQAINPCKVWPYDPRVQTPKFVTIKKIHAPKSAPEILLIAVDKKYLDINPIKITLPHVNNVTL